MLAKKGPGKQQRVLRPGETCWRLCRASRAAVLVDGESYFPAVADALSRARHSVLIAAWDLDSRVPLSRERDGLHARPLGRYLDELAARRRGLHIHLLAWDFPLLYSLEREVLPIFHLGWRTHRRVHLHLDGEHPLGASHHQKLVVVDDRVAFCGGLDLTQRRWDTRAHRAQEPLRRDPQGAPYAPFHDVQMAVEGEAAARIGALLRHRWRCATGRRLPAPPRSGEPGVHHDVWPRGVVADFENVSVGIARTEPSFKGRAGVREVERLYLAAIAAAREHIYIENQYFAASVVADALAARLGESDGPEVVLVLNLNASGWLEASTMDALRGHFVERLQAADRHGRLRVFCPVVRTESGEVDVTVHAKVLVVDDRLLRVGSSNLNNRSMGLDTECDVAIEAGAEPRTHRAVRAVRDGLLAEHLGRTPREVAAAIDRAGSLIRGIEGLHGGTRDLRPLREKAPRTRDNLLHHPEWADPERPVAIDSMIEAMLHEPSETREGFRWSWLLRGVAFLAIVVGVAAVWHISPLAARLDRTLLIDWGHALNREPLAPVYVLAAYVVGGLVGFPITILIGATAAVFDWLPGLAYAVGGSLLSAVITYGVGSALGRRWVRRMGGRRLNRLSRRLARSGLVAMLVVRSLPVAPFTVINLVAGASHIRLRDFVLGTALGMAPGILVTTLAGNRLRAALESPSTGNLALLGGLCALMIASGLWLARRARRQPGAQPRDAAAARQSRAAEAGPE